MNNTTLHLMCDCYLLTVLIIAFILVCYSLKYFIMCMILTLIYGTVMGMFICYCLYTQNTLVHFFNT